MLLPSQRRSLCPPSHLEAHLFSTEEPLLSIFIMSSLLFGKCFVLPNPVTEVWRRCGAGTPTVGPRPRRRGAADQLYRARSRLYRSQILQVNMCLKALAEIYKMHSFAQLLDSSAISIFSQNLPNFSLNSAKIFKFANMFANFAKFSKCSKISE